MEECGTERGMDGARLSPSRKGAREREREAPVISRVAARANVTVSPFCGDTGADGPSTSLSLLSQSFLISTRRERSDSPWNRTGLTRPISIYNEVSPLCDDNRVH